MSCAENDHFGFSLREENIFFLLAVDVSMYNSGLNDFVKTYHEKTWTVLLLSAYIYSYVIWLHNAFYNCM